MGGLIKFVTKDPSTDTFSGRVEAGTSDVHNGPHLGYSFRGSVNVPLSEKRAQAVKRYFQQVAPLSFPNSRFKQVSGHGSQNPIGPNTSPAGKALNRRVEITQIGQ